MISSSRFLREAELPDAGEFILNRPFVFFESIPAQFLALVFIVFVGGRIHVLDAAAAGLATAQDNRQEIEIPRDLSYATHDSVALKGDHYVPKGSGSYPVTIAGCRLISTRDWPLRTCRGSP